MSAGINVEGVGANRTDRLDLLAPKFRAAVEAAVAECRANGLPVRVFETYRSAELQALYFSRGRTIKPPTAPVTNAMSHLKSWHGYGLAIDVVHETAFWNPPGGTAWFGTVAQVFARHGCKWGGEWTKPDPPHFQWGACKPSPSDAAQALLQTRGIRAVWEAVGAADPLTI